ncbi:MAG: SDR family NAD(P)-dependent oxidoreductase [Gammaproteobacteria bacterium]|nr:SDR family NAD(P)-dependent oxidoreductase [Gammaproteobacteria bacterium]MCH9743534.1 SDR family NAD(P)-dependent oxidoreductase [Gammaproteobacteria bacterium]
MTGATGGIGKSISKILLEQGYNLILVARTLDKLIEFKNDIERQYPESEVTIKSCDVSKSENVHNLFSDLGNDIKISVLVNGAGISGGGITADISDELWINVINTNLNSMFFVTRECLRLNLIPQGGKIINIASTGGKQGVIYGAPYCASKHGMVGFSKALGLELARNNSGITVNAICPGFVETEMAERVRKHYAKIWDTTEEDAKQRVEARVPIGRYIEPDEVAGMLSYLISPAARGVTAQAFNVCGGLGNY